MNIPVMKEVESSMVKAVGYDVDAQKLFVRFNNGNLYAYAAVPQGVVNSLNASPSVGKFINSQIKLIYEFEQVTE